MAGGWRMFDALLLRNRCWQRRVWRWTQRFRLGFTGIPKTAKVIDALFSLWGVWIDIGCWPEWMDGQHSFWRANRSHSRLWITHIWPNLFTSLWFCLHWLHRHPSVKSWNDVAQAFVGNLWCYWSVLCVLHTHRWLVFVKQCFDDDMVFETKNYPILLAHTVSLLTVLRFYTWGNTRLDVALRPSRKPLLCHSLSLLLNHHPGVWQPSKKTILQSV